LDRVSCMAPGRCGAPERESPRRYRASRCPTATQSVLVVCRQTQSGVRRSRSSSRECRSC
jgi:hypothetical protein